MIQGDAFGEGMRGRRTMDSRNRVRGGSRGPRRHDRRAGRRSMTSCDTWRGPLVWALSLMLLIILAGVLPTPSDGLPSTTASIEVRVTRADTLWDIASQHRLPGLSTAETVQAILRENVLESSEIHPGDRLRVPVSSVSRSALALAQEGTPAN